MEQDETPTERPVTALLCERCGRPFPLAELEWWHGELLCEACHSEEDNCGCGDDDPAE